jgi:hypothetical protein
LNLKSKIGGMIMNQFDQEIKKQLQEMIATGKIEKEILKHITNDIFDDLFVKENVLSKMELKQSFYVITNIDLLQNVHLSKILDVVFAVYKDKMYSKQSLTPTICYNILKWTKDPTFELKVLDELKGSELSKLIEGELIYLLNSKGGGDINFSDRFYPYITEEMHYRYYSLIDQSIKKGRLIPTNNHRGMIVNKHSLDTKLDYIKNNKSSITMVTLFDLLKSVYYEGNEVIDENVVQALFNSEDLAVLIQEDFLPIETRYHLVKTNKLLNKIFQEQKYQAIKKLIDDHEYLFSGTIIQLLESLSNTLDSNYLFALLDYYIKNGLEYNRRKLQNYAKKRRSKTSQKLFLDLYESIRNWNKYKIRFPDLERFKKYLSLEELTSLRITILEEKTRWGLKQ